MGEDFFSKILGGTASLMLGITVLFYVIEDRKTGYRGTWVNNFRLYIGSIGGIILGCVLIYKAIFG